jgi:hypothetical protein
MPEVSSFTVTNNNTSAVFLNVPGGAVVPIAAGGTSPPQRTNGNYRVTSERGVGLFALRLLNTGSLEITPEDGDPKSFIVTSTLA